MSIERMYRAHEALNQKADFDILGYELFENFGGYEGNIVLAAYGPNGEKVYQEV